MKTPPEKKTKSTSPESTKSTPEKKSPPAKKTSPKQTKELPLASQTAGSKSRVPPTAGSTPATTNTMTRSRKKKAAPQPPGVAPLASSKASTGVKKQGPRSSLPYMAFRVKVGILKLLVGNSKNQDVCFLSSITLKPTRKPSRAMTPRKQPLRAAKDPREAKDGTWS